MFLFIKSLDVITSHYFVYLMIIYIITFTIVVIFFFLVCLRLQANPQNKAQFSDISPERGFADFIFAHIVLHLTIVNFIG